MKKNIVSFVLMAMLCACAATTVPEFKNNTKKPIDLGDKSATSCAYYAIGFLFGPFGENLSLPQTAQKSNINEITYYDISRSNYVLYAKKCLNVYGR